MQKTINFKERDIHYTYLQPQQDNHASAHTTLMLIHGFPESGSIFQHQITALCPYYAILVPDLPGSGDSPFNPSLHSVGDYAAGLRHIIEAEQIEKLVIIGHSMGGYIALAFAENDSDKLLGLGLLHSTAFADSAEKKANRLKAIQTMARYGGPAFLRSMIPALFGAAFKAVHPEQIQALIAAGSTFETEALQQYYQIMHDRTDKTALLERLNIPILLVSGTEDQAAPAADLILQSTLPAIAQIEVLDQSGHMGFLEKPDKVSRILKDFLTLTCNLGKKY